MGSSLSGNGTGKIRITVQAILTFAVAIPVFVLHDTEAVSGMQELVHLMQVKIFTKRSGKPIALVWALAGVGITVSDIR